MKTCMGKYGKTCVSVFFAVWSALFVSCSGSRVVLPVAENVILPCRSVKVSLPLPDYANSYLERVTIRNVKGDSVVLYACEWAKGDTLSVKEVSGEWFRLVFRPECGRIDLDVASNRGKEERGLKINMKRIPMPGMGHSPAHILVTQRAKYWQGHGDKELLWKKERDEYRKRWSGYVFYFDDGADGCLWSGIFSVRRL